MTKSEHQTKAHKEMQHQLEILNTTLTVLLERANERDRITDQMYAKVEEMYRPFKDGELVAGAIIWFIKWGFATLIAIGGAYLMYKQIVDDKIF